MRDEQLLGQVFQLAARMDRLSPRSQEYVGLDVDLSRAVHKLAGENRWKQRHKPDKKVLVYMTPDGYDCLVIWRELKQSAMGGEMQVDEIRFSVTRAETLL